MTYSGIRSMPPGAERGSGRTLFRIGLTALICIVAMLALAASASATATRWTTFGLGGPGVEVKIPAVSCTAVNACTAVGTFREGLSLRKFSAHRWNGEKWEYQSVPSPTTNEEAVLNGVSCSSATSCIAVGGSKLGGKLTPAAVRWNGTTWSAQTLTPPEKQTETRLNGISCSTGSFCITVGYYLSGGLKMPTAAIWNGTTYTWLTLPLPEKIEEGALNGVSCTSTTCYLVGSYKAGGAVKPLAIKFTGTKLELLAPPTPEKGSEAKFQAVSCVSTEWCEAVGSYKNSSGAVTLLAERLMATTWTVQTAPAGEATSATFNAVSCFSTTYCVASGGSTNKESIGRPVASRFEGAIWLPESPNYTPGFVAEQPLLGTSCTSATRCMLVGYTGSPGSFNGSSQTMARLNAPVNTVAPSISPGAPETGVAATASPGTWTEEPTLTYQWLRCNSGGAECANIVGATKATYWPLKADVGGTLEVKVTATNVAGSASANSSASGVVKKAGLITEYALPPGSEPGGIAVGPDGNLWFTDAGTNSVGKITPTGTITEYSVAGLGASGPVSIAKGPDGNMWITFSTSVGHVAKITTSGVVTAYTLSQNMDNGGVITAGPDGNMWFAASENAIGKITTAGTFTAYKLTGNSSPTGLTVGPDGNLWFNRTSTAIVKMTTAGTVTEYPVPAKMHSFITTGPDEKLWFTTWEGTVGKMSTTGTVTEYALPQSTQVLGIDEGPEGLLWFAHAGSDKVGKITTGGTATEYALPTGSRPFGITAGPDGNLWFTEHDSNRIGMIEP